MGQIHGNQKFENRYNKLEDEVRRLRGAKIQPESFITMPAIVGDLSPSIAVEGLLIVGCKIVIYDGSGDADVSFNVYRQDPPLLPDLSGSEDNLVTITSGSCSGGPTPWVDDDVYYELEENDLFYPTVDSVTDGTTMITMTFNTVSA